MKHRADSTKNRWRLYGDLAWTWPIISPPEDYVGEAETFVKEIRTHSRIEVNTLLDLGCGGGHYDFTLKKHFEVTGVDISESMLSLARRLNPEVAYFRGDMRSIRLAKTFDAVMAADSVNYMMTVDDLKQVFTTAFIHLKPGGVFCTYAEETAGRFQHNKTQSSTHIKDDVQITFIENLYDPDPSDTTYEMTFVYLIRRVGKLQVETDHHLCGIFPLETWIALLGEVGFEVHQSEFEEDKIPFFTCLKPDNKDGRRV
jgi:SAM-dependent methyltransferase